MRLLDWLDCWLTPCPRHLRDMGQMRELSGIRRRWRRFADAWAPHCERTRCLVVQAMAQCPQRHRAIVVGSGFLHDVPLRELSEAFREVVLVDLVHPLSTRFAVRRYRNVRLVAGDITNALASIHACAHTGDALPRPQAGLADAAEADLLVSLNLLSQLPCMAESYLRRQGSHSDADIAALCRHLIQAHLEYLRDRRGVTTVISDTVVRILDAFGNEVSRRSTLWDLPFPWSGEEWTWLLVPRRDRFPHHAEELQVVGVVDVPR